MWRCKFSGRRGWWLVSYFLLLALSEVHLYSQTQHYHAFTRFFSVLDISASGYYDWCDRERNKAVRDNERLVKKYAVITKLVDLFMAPLLFKKITGWWSDRESPTSNSLNEGWRYCVWNDTKFVISGSFKQVTSLTPNRSKRRFYREKNSTKIVAFALIVAWWCRGKSKGGGIRIKGVHARWAVIVYYWKATTCCTAYVVKVSVLTI